MGHNKIIINRGFSPEGLANIHKLIDHLRGEYDLKTIGMWMGRRVGDLAGGGSHPFSDDQLMWAAYTAKNPHDTGYLYKQWSNEDIQNNIATLKKFDRFIHMPLPSMEVDNRIIDQLKNEFYSPQLHGGGNAAGDPIIDMIGTCPPGPVAKKSDFDTISSIDEAYHDYLNHELYQTGGKKKKVIKGTRTLRQKIAKKNAKKVESVHKTVRHASVSDIGDIMKYSTLLDKSPDQLSKKELEFINSNPILMEVYRNIYFAFFNMV